MLVRVINPATRHALRPVSSATARQSSKHTAMAIKEASSSPVLNESSGSSGTILKPGADTRHYRAIKLDNGARFVVVQDTEAVFAAAAVNVAAGYMNDPEAVPGLAHFLEHAVHLGSEPYPEEGQYKAYLALHGGASNASTGMNNTVYHFTVAHQALQGALSQVAQFFISPLLRPEAVAREVENVHSEFSRNCNSDSRKILQVRRSLCRGPYSQFSTGNITTLRDTPQSQGIDTAQLLRRFWEQHYTADRICGCVVAPQTLDELEAWVRSSFKDIRPAHTLQHAPALAVVTNLNGAVHGDPQGASNSSITSGSPPGAPAAAAQSVVCTSAAAAAGGSGVQGGDIPVQGGDMSEMSDVARPGAELGCMIRINPQRSAMRSLELSWLIPYSPITNWRCKPWQWVGHLLGHEGPGSLAAALKQQGLCTSLEVGTGDQMRSEPGFMWWGVSLELTPLGLQHVPQIIVAIHHALAMINGLPDQERVRIYEEAAQVSRLRWEFADRCEPRDLARDLALRCHHYEPDQLLAGPSLLHGYDGPAISRFLSHLTPARVVVVLVAEGIAGAQPLKERWYGGRYVTHTLDQHLVSACEAALVSSPAAGLPRNQPAPEITILPLPMTCTIINSTVNGGSNNGTDDGQLGSTGSVPDAARDARGGVLVLPALHPPLANWALPVDTRLVSRSHTPAHTPAEPQQQQAMQEQQHVQAEQHQEQQHVQAEQHQEQQHVQAAATDVSGPSAAADPVNAGVPQQDTAPVVVVDTPSIKMWHRTDTTWCIPKAHVHLHLITPLVYASPTSWITARLFVRLLQDLLQPDVYCAELLGTSYDIGCTETGFSLHLQGFSSVVPQLLCHVLEGINRLAVDIDHVTARYPVMASRLTQHLQLWSHNNPIQHAEYAAEHVLQVTHWHVNDSLAALLVEPTQQPPLEEGGTQSATTTTVTSTDQHMPDAAAVPTSATTTADDSSNVTTAMYRPEVGPAAVCDMARSLKSQLYVEGLCYGNMTGEQAADLAHVVQRLLQPAGLPTEQWPAVHILRLGPSSPTPQPPPSTALPQSASSPEPPQPPPSTASRQPASSTVLKGVDVRHVVNNPNPSNSNSALVYICQVCDTHEPGTAGTEVCLELLVQMSSKRCFHALRTTQRLGYLVSLSEHRTCGVVGVQVRIQSPSHVPDVLRGRVHGWLRDYRAELAATTDSQLSGFKASLYSKLAQPPKSLSQATSRSWHHIRNRTYAFQRRADKLGALQALTLPDILQFYDQYLLPGYSADVTLEAAQGEQHTGSGSSKVETAALVGSSCVLSCEVWGGAGQPGQEQLATWQDHPHTVLVTDGQVPGFKAFQQHFTAKPSARN